MSGDDHQFDRRFADANVAALSSRVTILEGRMGRVEESVMQNSRELHANTTLTKQVHEMAEATKKDTADIVEAVKWLGTSKKVGAVVAGALGGAAGLIVAVVGAAKAMGWM